MQISLLEEKLLYRSVKSSVREALMGSFYDLVLIKIGVIKIKND